MLGQRRRRWPNIKPTLYTCLVFVGIIMSQPSDEDGLVHALASETETV